MHSSWQIVPGLWSRTSRSARTVPASARVRERSVSKDYAGAGIFEHSRIRRHSCGCRGAGMREE